MIKGRVEIIKMVLFSIGFLFFTFFHCFFNIFIFSFARQVLIIGGGDGGVAREVVKHPFVETVVQCEIDADVVNASRKFLPNMAVGFDSPKMNLHVGDGFEFMKNHQSEFDVIIADTSDPEGKYL